MQVWFGDEMVGNLDVDKSSGSRSEIHLAVMQADQFIFNSDADSDDPLSEPVISYLRLKIGRRSRLIPDDLMSKTTASAYDIAEVFNIPIHDTTLVKDYHQETMQWRYTWNVIRLESRDQFEKVFDLPSFTPV